MTAMPYNNNSNNNPQGKVIDASSLGQISPRWISNNNRKNQQDIVAEEEEENWFVSGKNSRTKTKTNTNTNTNSSSNTSNKSRSRSSSVCCSIDSEPTSILDHTRRSPSSPTSSTALSSFNGTAAAAVVTTNNSCCPVSLPETTTSGGGGGGGVGGCGGGVRKEDWAAELQNLQHNGSDIVSGCPAAGGGGGGEGGLGLGDFESMFQVGDGSLVPWLVGESEELGGLGLKHFLSSGNPLDYIGGSGVGGCGGGSGIGDVDEGSGGMSCEGSFLASLSSNLGFTGSGFHSSGMVGSLMNPTCSSGAPGFVPNANPPSGLFSSLMNNNNNNPSPVSLQAGGLVLHQHNQFDVGDEKHRVFSPQLLINQHQAAQAIPSSMMLSPPLGFCQLDQNVAQPQAKRLSPGAAFDSGIGRGPFLVDQGHRKRFEMQHQQSFPVALGPSMVPQQKPMMVSKQKLSGIGNEMVQQQQQQQQQHYQLQEQAARDLLHKVVDLIQTGNFSHAQEILARLNHTQHPVPAKPLIRVALCVKEALQLLLLMGNPAAIPPPKCLSPVDVVHKMNAYKVFSEVSPFMQFVNFTTTQAVLEELEDAESIHIMDFDIGCGAKWASFIQELPLRKLRARSLKITAFTSFSTYHQLELALMHENLTQFANDVGIALDLQIVNFDLFDPSNSTMPNFRASGNEVIAVYFPFWVSSSRPYLSHPLLRFIRQHSPKIMVSLDRGCDRIDLPFSQHLLHALDSCSNLLESLDCPNVPSDVVNKIEKFFVQPAIESALLGRLHVQDKVPPWKNLFAASGFSPLSFSNLTETQADYVVKRTPGRGFRVDKRQNSLVLSWQGRELVAASAWKC